MQKIRYVVTKTYEVTLEELGEDEVFQEWAEEDGMPIDEWLQDNLGEVQDYIAEQIDDDDIYAYLHCVDKDSDIDVVED